MADYNIDINVNMGGSQGNFQTLIDSVNNLNASFAKVGTAATTAGSAAKQSFADSMAIMKDAGGTVDSLKAKINELKKSIIDEGAALKKGSTTQAEYNKRVNESAAEIKKHETALRRINSVLGQTDSHAKKASTGISGLTNAFNKLGAVLGISFGLYGVFRVLRDGIKTIADFDMEMKKLQSILGETADSMNGIKQSAIEIGKSSIFGAKGVGELQVELAKMGFAKQDIIDMTQAIVNLATATQEDLASSAEVVANVLRAYQLDATDATRVTNVMGKAFNDSALDLANFREAIKYVGPIAAQAGFSFEETVAALELLSQVGIKGSLAGTGLTNVMRAMMDANSKLSKSLGGTAKGFEGFKSVLEKAKNEGWDTEKVFGVITQRATAAFTTFQNGVETIDNFKGGLIGVGDIMQEQTNVQLGSLENQAKLTKEAFHNLWLEIESGEGVMGKIGKGFLQFVRALMLSEGSVTDLILSYKIRIEEIKDALVVVGGLGSIQDQKALEATKKLLEDNLKILEAGNFSTIWFQQHAKMYKDSLEFSKKIEGLSLPAIAKKYVDEFNKYIVESKDVEGSFKKISSLLVSLQKDTKEGSFEWLAYEKSIKAVDERYAALKAMGKVKELTKEELDALKKANEERLKEYYKYQLELLKLEKQLSDEKIKYQTDESLQSSFLEENNYVFKKKYAELELEMAIALGEDRVKAAEKTSLELQAIEYEHYNNLAKIRETSVNKMIDDIDKENYDIINTMLQNDENEAKTNELLAERLEKIKDFMKDWARDNPILNILMGGYLNDQLSAGTMSTDDIERFTEGVEIAFDSIKDSLGELVDSWVESTDLVVDQLNRQVDETQSALDTEIELMKAGYASNVTLKKQELADLKKARKDALKEQEKAQKAQNAIDTLQQISSLVTASAQIIEGFSTIPVVGVALGILAVGAMIAAFAAAKVKASQLAKTPRYAEGGWIGGRSHREGGTHIEAEKGEFVVKRSSAVKHNKLIEAINNDNTYEINKIYLDKVKGQIVTARVSLDDSKDLRAIRKLMEKQGKSVEYSGNYRIEKVGNVTTKILLN